MTQQPTKSGHAWPATIADTSIWSTKPGLEHVPDEQYYGRIFVEVWDTATSFVVASTAEDALARAVAALKRTGAAAQKHAVPWKEEPVTSQIADQTFLGRVVVEFWKTREVVAVSGTDSRVLEKAIQQLEAAKLV
jgi:hypothetical protein